MHDPEGSHYENADGGKIKRAQNDREWEAQDDVRRDCHAFGWLGELT